MLVFCLLGTVAGTFLGAKVFVFPSAPGEEGIDGLSTGGVTIVCGFLGAVVAAVVGHLVGLAVAEPPSPPSPVEAKAEAERRETLAEIALAEHLLAKAERDGDEDVRKKLVGYKSPPEHELIARAGKARDESGPD